MYCCYAVTSKETKLNTNVFIRCDGAQCFDEIFTNFFSAGNSNSSLVRKIQKVSIVVVPLLHRAKYKCLHQMWQCTVGDFWQKAKLSPLDTIFWTNLGWGRALHTGRLLKIRVTTDWHDTVSAQWDSHPHDNFHLTRFFSLDTCVNLTVNSSMQC